MKIANTSQRLKQLMNDRNLRQIDILNLTKPYCEQYQVKMNKSDISQYVSGKNEPSQEKLVVLGMALNVSESWLMGFDVPMERDKWERVKKSYNELSAFDAELAALGWKCTLYYCNAWEEVEMGIHEGTPIGCTLPDGRHEKCTTCYMKTPKYVFSNGTTSFEVSSKDYSDFLKDSKAFFLKRIQKLMLKSTNTLFETELNAAHDAGATPEQKANADNIMMDDSEWE